MADTKLSALTELAAAPASDDEVYIRDVSEAAADESKRITISNLFSQPPAMTLGGTVTINGQVFDAGSGSAEIDTTGLAQGLLVQDTQDGVYGAYIIGRHVSANPANNDVVVAYQGQGKDDGGTTRTYGELKIEIEDVQAASNTGNFKVRLRYSGGGNDAMNLSGAGGLTVDADVGTADDPVGLYDGWDDPIILERGISKRQFNVLEELGVMERKDTGSGWMLNIQKMCYLLAGGIYQNRAKIDNLEKKLLTAF